MNSDQIRQAYLDYFKKREHEVIESSPVVPQGDPTLLFTNAGMNQFKDLLLGNEVRDYKRAASVQKCIRAGGKHNDLDEVGKDGRHLTFFEMLGNWSFGDYYKKASIEWAWDFCLNVLELDPARLYVTVHNDDNESLAIWRDEIKVDPNHILKLGDKDNFWAMGPTGPCGPCTEIHIDLQPEKGPFEFVDGYDPDRIVEIWNLVFMESNRLEDESLEPLPMKSVDTGMGLDRVAMVKANSNNVFHTDLFKPLMAKAAELLGTPVRDWQEFFVSEKFTNFSVIADHIRTVTFALCDGAKFSNDGRGYVLRRILRRAVRYGRELGFEGPFLHQIAAVVVENYGHVYPELKTGGSRASEMIRLEEERFFRNIDRGIELFEQAAAESKDVISGARVFELHATYGFPPDLTEIMAEEKGLGIDKTEYEALWVQHQNASRGKDLYADAAGVGDWITVHEGPSSTFVGYTDLEAKTRVMKFRRIDEERFELVLEKTPFYAESGGQVGDKGEIQVGNLHFAVSDTQKAPIGILHSATLEDGVFTVDSLKGEVLAKVNAHERSLIMANHTATHLLHAALRGLVSDAIFQAGSMVAPEKLRFDFSHPEPLTASQVKAVEDAVNAEIAKALPVTIYENVDRERAISEMGAMAIFGEKYGDNVRVVSIPGSVELCGGTHVSNTSEIRLFRLVSESGVAAGIRRIEAVTSQGALLAVADDRNKIKSVANVLKADVHNLVERAQNLVAEKSELEKLVEKLQQKLASQESADLLKDAVEIDGITVISKAIQVENRDQLLAFADALRSKLKLGIVLLGTELEGKAALICLVTDEAFKSKKVKAGDLINAVAPFVDGRGGGRPTLAQAGGSKPEGIPTAIAEFESKVRELLS